MSEAWSAWESVQAAEPIPAGRSELWRVTVDRQDCVARRSSESVSSLRWLAQTHQIAERAGFQVPGLIPTRNGAISSRGWTMERFLIGTPATAKDLPELTPLLARFHRLARKMPARPGHPAMAHIARNVAMRRILSGLAHSVVHGDVHAGNVIRMSTGRFGLIDWEESRRDYVGFDYMWRRGVQGGPLHLAYEVEACWEPEPEPEPERARRMARRLRGFNRRA